MGELPRVGPLVGPIGAPHPEVHMALLLRDPYIRGPIQWAPQGGPLQGPFGPFLAQSKPIRGQIRTQRKISGPLVASDPIQHAFGRFSSFLTLFRWKQAILRPDSDSSCPCHIYGTKNHENRSIFDRPLKIRAGGPLGKEAARAERCSRALLPGAPWLLFFAAIKNRIFQDLSWPL